MATHPVPPKKRLRKQSLLLGWLNRGTAHFYAALLHSSWGRFMTGYHKSEDKLIGNKAYVGRHRCAPVSETRQEIAGAVESCGAVKLIRALFGGFMEAPTACYGLFGLLYGLFSVLIYFIGPHVLDGFVRVPWDLITSIAAAVLALPLLLSRRCLAESLGNSLFAKSFLVGFLGVPGDRLVSRGIRHLPEQTAVWYAAAAFFGIASSVANLFIPSWVIPLALPAIALLGMVFTYPETGVVLITLMLPLVWLSEWTLAVVVGLIMLTWLSYIAKLLLLHRTIRFGFLDRIMVILGFMILAAGFTGYRVGPASIWQGVSLAVCLSSYFLIVNLVTTRDFVRRCLVGVGVSVVVVTVLAYLRHVPVDSLLWLEGSRAGDAIIQGSRALMGLLSQLWVDHSELYLVLIFSWLYAYILHTKRLFRKFWGVMFILLDLFLILLTNSVSALLCVVAVTILFLLMLGHKWLTAGLLALPGVVCGAFWLHYLYPLSEAMLTVLARSRLYKAQLRESLWHMVGDHPVGLGLGSEAFDAVYPLYAAPDLGGVDDCGNIGFEILLSYGWIGILVFSLVLILFLQKSFSTLRHTVLLKDRAMILGGVTSLLGIVIFGCVRSFITSPRVFFTIILVVALCSAYENVIYEESRVDAARCEQNEHSEDRFYRKGQFPGK